MLNCMQWHHINKAEKKNSRTHILNIRVQSLLNSIAEIDCPKKQEKKSKVVVGIVWKVYMLANADDDDSDIGSCALGVCAYCCVYWLCVYSDD